MREIDIKKITETVANLCQQANYLLPEDVWQVVEQSFPKEKSETGREILGQIMQNARLSVHRSTALCQDTGIAEIFVKIGQDVHVSGGDLQKALVLGVREGYTKGFLRKSIVSDPIIRENTGDNTPPQVYIEIVHGNNIDITLLPKGGGTENASALKMLMPSDGWEGIEEFVLETINTKGGKACPPLIVGLGIGGSFSSVALLAKKALLRDIRVRSDDLNYAERERGLLIEINKTGIGPMGLGGNTTALAVNIEVAPCHIASLPVAVSMQCHSLRKRTAVI